MKLFHQKPLKSILKPKGQKNSKGINFDLDQNIVEEFRKDQRVDWVITQDMKQVKAHLKGEEFKEEEKKLTGKDKKEAKKNAKAEK